jgi:Entner-Doudoroff aldolase
MQLSDPTPLITMPVIPVVTIERATDAIPLARALLAGGISVMEITLRTPAALEAVRAIIAEVKEIIVGVGTVVKPLDVTHAIDAGADFLVSPGTPTNLAQALADAPVPALPGCATVSEAMTLAALGFPVLKLFPAEPAGGVRWLKAVIEPDRRRERRQRGVLPRAAERPGGGRLLGRAAGGRRCRRFRRHHRARPHRGGVASLTRVSSEAPIQRRPRKTFDWSSATIAVAVAVSAVVVYWRDGQARFLEILFSDLALFVDILPKVLAACLIAAFVAVLMPRETVMRWVGAESGLLGIVIATLAGTICPGGPITIFPIAAAFVAIGADTGAAIAFITSWTLLGYARILVWELPFFGGEFVIWRTIISIPLPILAGFLARFIAGRLAARKRSEGGGG